MRMHPFYRKKNSNPPPILFQVFTDGDKILAHDVFEVTEKHYRCYSAWGPRQYDLVKTKVWTDREALKYTRWARRVNQKPSKDRYRLLNNTTNEVYKKKYITDFPEKVI